VDTVVGRQGGEAREDGDRATPLIRVANGLLAPTVSILLSAAVSVADHLVPSRGVTTVRATLPARGAR
jgi:hypothetical protein